jgi:hypothetical protein
MVSALALTVPRVACGTVLEALQVGFDSEWTPLVLDKFDSANRVGRATVGEFDHDLLGGGANKEQHEAAKPHHIGLALNVSARRGFPGMRHRV